MRVCKLYEECVNAEDCKDYHPNRVIKINLMREKKKKAKKK